ncbi:MAG: hypothetical protein ACEQSK_12770 [Sphingomonadaceae bacterium]
MRVPDCLRWLLAAALCAACALASGADKAPARTPFQIRCEDTINKTISVLSSKTNGYTINNQLPYKALTARAGSVAGNMATLGLTVTQGEYRASMGGAMLQDAVSGYECIAPEVGIALNYSPVKIYVGSEFVPGSCGYQVILTHELRHMQAYMDNLARVEKVVRQALDRRFEGKPLYAPSGTAMSALQHEINSVWFPFIRDEFEKGKPQQDAIDTPEEYARMGKVCDGEIAEIIKRSRLPRQRIN